MMGNHLAETPATIEDRQSELADLHKRVFPLTVVTPDIKPQGDGDGANCRKTKGLTTGSHIEADIEKLGMLR